MTEIAADVQALRELLEEVARRHLSGQPCRWLVVGMSRDDNPKTTALLFADGRDPVLAVKVATTWAAGAAVRAEAVALQTIAALDRGRLGASVPRFIDVLDHGLGCALVMSVVPGHPMSLDYHRRGHIARPAAVATDLRHASDWLARLRALPATPASTRPGAPDWPAAIRARWPGWGPADRAAAVAEQARDRLGPANRIRISHGDFWCGNVLRSDHGVSGVSGVVDWEHLRSDGDPIDDPVRMAVSYSLYLDRHTRPGHRVPGHPGLISGEWGAGLRYAIHGSGWYPDLLAEFLGVALRAGGRSPGLWREALLWGAASVAAGADEDRFARDHACLLAEVAR